MNEYIIWYLIISYIVFWPTLKLIVSQVRNGLKGENKYIFDIYYKRFNDCMDSPSLVLIVILVYIMMVPILFPFAIITAFAQHAKEEKEKLKEDGKTD